MERLNVKAGGKLGAALAVLVALSAPRAHGQQAAPAPQSAPAQSAPAQPAPASEHPQAPAGATDFDLLPPEKPTASVDEGALRRRRALLNVHQGVGLGVLAVSLANTVVGQLNYSDRFAGGPSTGRYQQTHQVLAYATLASFATAGVLAVLAPNPIEKHGGFDRLTVHKISMATATAGMVAEGVLGVITAQREGRLNQQGLADAHLVIGYVTFAAIAAGFGAIVF